MSISHVRIEKLFPKRYNNVFDKISFIIGNNNYFDITFNRFENVKKEFL